MKLLLLGISGLLGFNLANLSKEEFSVFGSYFYRKPKFENIELIKFETCNSDKINSIVSDIRPDYVINCIALNNVDYCEKNIIECEDVNYRFVDKLSFICNKLNTKLIHISTDSVFDGSKSIPYVENDVPKPINVYGRSKLSSEFSVLKYSQNLVVRASILYGWLPHYLSSLDSSSKKPQNFSQWLIHKLQKKEKIKIITDELSSPIIADDLANSILHLIRGNYNGIFHSAPPLQISRYDFSQKLANYLKLDSSLIHPTTNKELGRHVATSTNKCLDSKKIEKTGYTYFNLEKSFELIQNQIND